MNGGLCTVEGTTSGLSISLGDLQFLTANAGSDWFPQSQLGTFFSSTALQLLGISVGLSIALSPLSISLTSVELGIGLTGLALDPSRLYLSPLGVYVTIQDPVGVANVVWSIMGTLALCSSTTPGNYQNPDLALDMATDLTDFSVSASLENPSDVTVNAAIVDLLGAKASIGLADSLTVETFDIDLALQSDGTPSSFGLFESLTAEEIALCIQYTNDQTVGLR
jgi:hypothetical protein